MATTNAQRVKRSQARSRKKAQLFENMNTTRHRLMLGDNNDPRDGAPEQAMLFDFFLAYPDCWALPKSMTFIDGVWRVVAPCSRRWTSGETIAAHAAMRTITALPFLLENERGEPLDVEEDEAERVLEDVEELKRLGLWGAV